MKMYRRYCNAFTKYYIMVDVIILDEKNIICLTFISFSSKNQLSITYFNGIRKFELYMQKLHVFYVSVAENIWICGQSNLCIGESSWNTNSRSQTCRICVKWVFPVLKRFSSWSIAVMYLYLFKKNSEYSFTWFKKKLFIL